MNLAKEIQSVFHEMVLTESGPIRVSDICRRMNIARKTFYKYYEDKYALISALIHEEIFSPLTQLSQMANLRVEDSVTVLNSMYAKIYEDRDFYTRLNQLPGDENIFLRCIYQENKALNEILFAPSHENETEKAYHVHLAAMAGVSLLDKWMRDGYDLSSRQVSTLFYKYVTRAWVEILENYKG